MRNIYDIIVVGGGPGGYTAALYAARAGLSTLVIEKYSIGGQMALTPHIDNYPGFPEGVDGYTLGEQMRQGAERFGAQTLLAEVTALDLSPQPKLIHTSEGTYTAKAVILATGASPRLLGIPQEEELTGSGVSYCAHCDGMFYRDKTVVVVGGGNTAVADALTLSRIANKVILVHRRDTLRATKIYHDTLLNTPNVEIHWNSAVTALQGEFALSGVVITNLQTGTDTQIPCQGLFVSIGRSPASELVKGQLQLDEGGYILTDSSMQTNIPGVYAIGDVRNTPLRQIVTAVSDGAIAAASAEHYLSR